MHEFAGKRVPVLVNFRSFVSAEEFQQFVDTVIAHNYQVLYRDNKAYEVIKDEKD